jgi:hypothetical protein
MTARGYLSAANRVRLADIVRTVTKPDCASRKPVGPSTRSRRWLDHTKIRTTDTYLNATAQLLHELNDRPAIALVKR